MTIRVVLSELRLNGRARVERSELSWSDRTRGHLGTLLPERRRARAFGAWLCCGPMRSGGGGR